MVEISLPPQGTLSVWITVVEDYPSRLDPEPPVVMWPFMVAKALASRVDLYHYRRGIRDPLPTLDTLPYPEVSTITTVAILLWKPDRLR